MTESSSAEVSEEHPDATRSPWFRRAIVILFVVAACVRAIDVWRPLDGSVRQSWRETDTGAIARNFYREDMNILLPRIDWRGDGPGYVESEFPLFPWTAACLYHVFGYHEEILRVLSYLLSLGSCLIFLRLARRLLPRSTIIPAWTVFALSPMAVRMASAVQPEPLMFFAYLLAIDSFIRWIDHDWKRDYVVALLATTLAILAKVPAAHVGILFACLCLQKFGTSVFWRRDIWLFGVVSLGVPFAWYWHAHSLWLEYGNSLGISNEAYERISSGNFLMTLWETIPGVISIESAYIWMGGGLFFGVLGLLATRRSTMARPLGYWSLALAAFFIVTGRTTGEQWACYYHIVSTPLAAMLIGLGYTEAYRTHVLINRRLIVSVALAAAVSVMAGEINAGMIEPLLRIALVIGATAAVAGLVVDFENSLKSGRSPMRPGYLIPCRKLLVTGFGSIIAAQIGVVYLDANPNRQATMYQTAIAFSRHTDGGDLIVVGGFSEVDQHGIQRAADPPYYFYWMDRKGFILHDGEQSLARLQEFHRRGARYFVAERHFFDPVPGFESQLRQRYDVLDERGDTMLIDLGPPGAQPSESSQASATSDQPRGTPETEAADT